MRIKLVLGFWLLGITLAWWAVAPSGAGLAPAAGAVGGGAAWWAARQQKIYLSGLWSVGLGGGYVLGLTDRLDLSWLGLVTPLGVPGFWIGAVGGMLVAAAGIIGYYFVVSAPDRARAHQRAMEADRAPT